MEERIVSAISESAARTTAFLNAISTGIDGLTADIEALKALIEQLQNSPGGITPEDQGILDQMEALAGTLADRIAALDAETP
jgi:hypothetical protein